MKIILILISTLLFAGCAYTQITIKAVKGEPGPTVSKISIDTDVGYKGNVDSDGATSEAGGATADVSAPGL